MIDIFPRLKKTITLPFPQSLLKRDLSNFCITLLGIRIFIVGLTTLTLFQGHRCVRNINYELAFQILVEILVNCNLNVVWLLHVLRRPCTIWIVRRWCVQGSCFTSFGSVKSLCLSKTLTLGFCKTPNCNVKPCTMVLHVKLYILIKLSVTDIFSRSQHCQTVSSKFCFYPIKFNLCRIVKYMKQVMNTPLFFFFFFITFAHIKGR